MSNYIGVKCPVCGKKFTQSDDIVVCPVCGAPHHRACYAEKKECAFAADHISGTEWRPPAADSGSPPPYGAEAGGDFSSHNPFGPGTAACPACGASNPLEALFCQICGRRLTNRAQQNHRQPQEPLFPFTMNNTFGAQPDPSALIYGGLSPDEKIEEETVRDLAIYIGQNSVYYLPRFKSMDQESRTLSFNFAALLFNFVYYFYRKMYVIGGFLLGLSILGAVPTFLHMKELLPQLMYLSNLGPEASVDQAAAAHYQSLVQVTGTINFAIGFILSFCANRFYYSKALSDVKKIRARRADPPDERAYTGTLAEKGGVSKVAVIAAVSTVIAVNFLAGSALTYFYMMGM